ncbi:DUF2158 domain-containing protein [Burkholderia sp. 9120]|uniref:YodC family protein n=1 Tax=Burkholderiaceae TaxID=119060 RepID=UPI000555D909|nr:DUF2158 domain-containing protein [Burkholderia sp. 9120]
MASAKLVVGDVVKLKSGGPWLTVTEDKFKAGSKTVACSWFSGDDLRTEVFLREALESKNSPEAAPSVA